MKSISPISLMDWLLFLEGGVETTQEIKAVLKYLVRK